MEHIIWHVFFETLPKPAQMLISVVGFLLLALALLSITWTTLKTRAILNRSLGRNVRRGEETSLKTWMTLSDSQLDASLRELKKNPFRLQRGTTPRSGV